MTCVIGAVENGNIVFGADSIAIDSHSDYSIYQNRKIFIKNKILFGYAGCFRFGQMLEHQLKVPLHKSGISDDKYLSVYLINAIKKVFVENDYKHDEENWALIFGYNGRIYHVFSSFAVLAVDCGFAAIGAGANYALGAYYCIKEDSKNTEHKLSIALETAAKFNKAVCPPYHFLSLE